MRRFFRQWLAMFFVLWLPLQSATAFAMPIGSCAHSTTHTGTITKIHTHVEDQPSIHHGHELLHHSPADPHAQHAHHEGAHAADHASTGAHLDSTVSAHGSDSSCADCGLCQFACASALTSSAHQMPMPRPGALADAAPVFFYSITPSLPQPPPRAV